MRLQPQTAESDAGSLGSGGQGYKGWSLQKEVY